jgi:flavoprotein
MAYSLPLKGTMNRVCQHCGELIVGNTYRVTSEEEGITLLDMVVCSLCFMEAKRLRLHTEEIDVEANRLQLGAEGVTVRDSEFDCGLNFFEA